MSSRKLRSTALAVTAGLLLALLPAGAHADALSDLEAQIQRYQNQLAQINSQTISVKNQIADTQGRIDRLQVILGALNAQLLENNARLSDNQARLDALVVREDALTDQLDQTQTRLDERQAAFASQVRVLDKVEARTAFGLLLTSHSFGQFVQRLTDIKQAADGTHQTAVSLQSDRDLLAAQRAELDRERTEQVGIVAKIEDQRQALEQEYAFSHGQGGSVVAPEFLANSWGNYYNQRDARWGNVYLGRTQYEVWEIGCLLTSVAMVNSHFGYTNITPGVIAANPANFTSGGLLYNFALNVPGHSALINNNPSRAWINQVLAAGGTVIVGMYIRTGGTHFVVLVAQNGPYDYWINDPWVENAMHVSYVGSPVTGPIYDAIGYYP